MPNKLVSSENQQEIAEKILDARVRLLHEHLVTTTIPALLLCTTIMFASLYDSENKTILIGWYVAVILISALRLYFLKCYKQNPKQQQFHLNSFIIGSSASALILSISGTLLISSQDLAHQILIIIVIAGLTAGGSQTLQASKLANSIFMIMSILPLSVWISFQNENVDRYLGMAIFAYLIFMLLLAKKSYANLIHTLELRYENELLLKQLSASQKSLTLRHAVAHMLVEHLNSHEATTKVINKICKSLGLELDEECLNKQNCIEAFELFSKKIESKNIMDKETMNDINNQLAIFINREETQNKFDLLSRRAGMADVATSILHNAGNILNSIKVAVDLLNEKIRNKKNIKNLRSLSEMINSNLTDIQSYLTDDEKGKLIPKYLSILSNELTNDNKELEDDLNHLKENIWHMENIVSMQSDIGYVTLLPEKLFLPEIIETAIQISNIIVELPELALEKKFEHEVFLFTDKSKLLQIVVNLLKNAKDALTTEPDQTIKKITLQTENSPLHGFINLIVKDNGSGITAENLARIFSSGFTTKISGHGFGLHSSILIAKELGGDLQVKSQGRAQGAEFILTLPLFTEQTIQERRDPNGITV